MESNQAARSFDWVILIGIITALLSVVPLLFLLIMGGGSIVESAIGTYIVYSIPLSIVFALGLRYLGFVWISRILIFIPFLLTLYMWDFNVLALTEIITAIL